MRGCLCGLYFLFIKAIIVAIGIAQTEKQQAAPSHTAKTTTRKKSSHLSQIYNEQKNVIK